MLQLCSIVITKPNTVYIQTLAKVWLENTHPSAKAAAIQYVKVEQ